MQAPDRRDLSSASASDGGFTLIEVVVALSLLGIIAAAAVGLFVSALHEGDHLQERQVAVAVANQAMEQVHSIPPTASSTTTVLGAAGSGSGTAQVGGLVAGRTKAAVLAAWAAADFPDEAQTAPAWDPTTPAATVAIPMSATSVVASVPYTTQTFIGTCTLPSPGGACTTSAASGIALDRVVVKVTWRGCGSTCAYTTSALVDIHADQSWRVTS